MKCRVCAHTMKPLFTSAYCPRCEEGHLYEGWILLPDPDITMPYRSYVFRTRASAEDWARMRNADRGVRRVHSYVPFRWRSGVGSTAHMEFHHELCTVHLNSNHEKIEGHVHL